MEEWLESVDRMWEKSIERQLAVGSSDYWMKKDLYRARRIYDCYGYGKLYEFIQMRPLIRDKVDEYVPCLQNNGQCTMFCHRYLKGRCHNDGELD